MSEGAVVKKYKAEKVVVRDVAFSYGKGYDLTPKVEKTARELAREKIVLPDGKDHGSATRMLMSYMDEVLERTRETDTKQVVPADPIQKLPQGYNKSPFLDRVKHRALADIPLTSQKAAQIAIWPIHSNDKKKRVGDLASRLRRNDGSLVRMRLQSEGIDDMILEQISNSLPKNIFLQHLMLHDNAVTDNGLEKLCLALRWHPSIHTLWLGGNQIGDKGAQNIGLLLNRNHNIMDVNISNKWPRKTWSELEQIAHPHITHIGAEFIAKELMKCCGLTSLNLADQRLRDVGAKMIFQSLVPSRLRTLNLSKNEITDKAIISLSEALTSNPNLEKLVLKGNIIGDLGGTLIAKSLTRNHILQALDVSDNTIQAGGLQAFVDCLTYNHNLSSIFLVGNPGNDVRAEDIVMLRVTGQTQMAEHGERKALVGYNKGFTSVIPVGDVYGASSPPNSPDTQRLLDGIADFGRGMTPIPSSLQLATPTGSRAGGSRGGSRGNSRTSRRDASSPLAKMSIGTSGLRPRSRSLRPGTTEKHFSGEDDSSLKTAPSVDDDNSAYPGPVGVSTNRTPDGLAVYGPYKPFTPYGDKDAPSSPSGHGHNNMVGFSNLFASSSHGSPPGTPIMGNAIDKARASTPGTGNGRGGSSRGRPLSSEGSVGSRGGSRGGSRNRSRSGTREKKGVIITQGIEAKDLGHTLMIPKLGASGIRPIRSATSRHRDSGTHLMYLRISTPDDAEGARPVSLMKIARDHENALQAERDRRLTVEYKEQKRDALIEAAQHFNSAPSRGALKPPPPGFWQQHKRSTQIKYPKGIDRAVGCTSTAFDPKAADLDGYGTSFLEMMRLERELGIKNYKEPPKKVTNAAEAFVMRRREARVRRIKEERESTAVERAKAAFGAMTGLKPDQTLGDLSNKKGLTAATSYHERKKDFQARKEVIY